MSTPCRTQHSVSARTRVASFTVTLGKKPGAKHLTPRRFCPNDSSSPGCSNAWLDVWKRAKRGRVRASHLQSPTRSSSHTDALVVRSIVWSCDAVLDGRFYAAESSSVAAIRTSERRSVALGCNRFRHPSPGRDIFTSFPVPINNRIAKWTPESLPNDWQTQEHRWDTYHWLRTCGLVVAFALLVLSLAVSLIQLGHRLPHGELGMSSSLKCRIIKQSQAQLLLGLFIHVCGNRRKRIRTAIVCWHLARPARQAFSTAYLHKLTGSQCGSIDFHCYRRRARVT